MHIYILKPSMCQGHSLQSRDYMKNAFGSRDDQTLGDDGHLSQSL